MAVTKMPKLRVLDKAYPELLRDDPDSGLSKSELRRLALSGAVRTVQVGRKRLIDLDSVREYLAGASTSEPATVAVQPQGGIRRVEL